jgi:TolB protein
MKFHNAFKLLLAAASLAFVGPQARAQIDIERVGTGPGKGKPIWVSISGISGEALQVLQFDLYVQGFNFTNAESAQYLISGSANGNFTGRASDKFTKASLVSKAYSGGALRHQVHAFCDDFVTALDRTPLNYRKKIAYKHDTGANSELVISDFDGANATHGTKDGAILAAPAWVRGQMGVYYCSYKLGYPAIFRHDLASGSRKIVAGHGGSNISPAPSPDGSKVAMILSKDGWTDLYVGDANGGNLIRLTKSKQDESSPCWSPDGKWICFAAKVNERRGLYKVPAGGGEVQRIRTEGVLNPTEPDWSPDGKWIVFTSMMGGFEICVVPSGGGAAIQLVAGEDPSWAPNSRTIVYARRQGSTRKLSLLDVETKQFKDLARISGSSGSSSQPSWAK